MFPSEVGRSADCALGLGGREGRLAVLAGGLLGWDWLWCGVEWTVMGRVWAAGDMGVGAGGKRMGSRKGLFFWAEVCTIGRLSIKRLGWRPTEHPAW